MGGTCQIPKRNAQNTPTYVAGILTLWKYYNIYGKSINLHDVEAALKLLKEKGLTVKVKKCKFAQKPFWDTLWVEER